MVVITTVSLRPAIRAMIQHEMKVTTHQITFAAAFPALQSEAHVRSALQRITSALALNTLSETKHFFKPQGISMIFLLAESHIAIHTWPEKEFAYITLSSCAEDAFDRKKIEAILREEFDARTIDISEIGSQR